MTDANDYAIGEALRDILKELKIMNDLTIERLPDDIVRRDWVTRAQWKRES